MDKPESIEHFYLQRTQGVPSTLHSGIGHFNVFKFDDLLGCSIRPIPYSKREFFKISLIKGQNRINFSDTTVDVKNMHFYLQLHRYPTTGNRLVLSSQDIPVYSLLLFFIILVI